MLPANALSIPFNSSGWHAKNWAPHVLTHKVYINLVQAQNISEISLTLALGGLGNDYWCLVSKGVQTLVSWLTSFNPPIYPTWHIVDLECAPGYVICLSLLILICASASWRSTLLSSWEWWEFQQVMAIVVGLTELPQLSSTFPQANELPTREVLCAVELTTDGFYVT